jgi:PadR family transcriptional regulator, regulatory protein PadR
MRGVSVLGTQMRKGILGHCVLAMLDASPRYGFELVQLLGQADGLLTSEGTIYPLLSRMRGEKLVDTEWRESSSGPPRRYYLLTSMGRQALEEFRQEWTRFRVAVDGILQSGGNQ